MVEHNIHWSDLIENRLNDHVALLNRGEQDWIFGWNPLDILNVKQGKYDQNQVDSFILKNKGKYIFGYVSYDLKNKNTKKLLKKRHTEASDLYFVAFDSVLIKNNQTLLYYGTKAQSDLSQLLNHTRKSNNYTNERLELVPLISKEEYLLQINDIQRDIQLGNFYEVNHCIKFQTSYNEFQRGKYYQKLLSKTKAPFSCYFETPKETIMSGSPERFLSKKKEKLLSQPIKGTAKRDHDLIKDHEIKTDLKNDIKERAENVMIVDLVRNDLSKISAPGTVKVNELCQIYSFETVHQMISSVSCQIKDQIPFSGILEALFPMGSMTGAPKVSAMTSIHNRENFSREIYSGSVFSIDPLMNFDSNVVIRSIIEEKKEKKLYSCVGGAITIKSIPEKEYEECLLKLNAIKEVLC